MYNIFISLETLNGHNSTIRRRLIITTKQRSYQLMPIHPNIGSLFDIKRQRELSKAQAEKL